MRQVPLESDINIAVNGYSGFATSSQKGSFMTMLISRSRGTCLIYLSCQFHYNLMTTCHLDPEWFRAWRDRVIAGHHMNTPHTTLSSTNAGLRKKCLPWYGQEIPCPHQRALVLELPERAFQCSLQALQYGVSSCRREHGMHWGPMFHMDSR